MLLHVPALQTLEITVLNCGGMWDIMSEQEASFLNTSLPLFRNVQDIGRALPRANSRLVRAYKPAHLYNALTGQEDLLHIVAHATDTALDVGKNKVAADNLRSRAAKGLRMPKVVVSTACKFSSKDWHAALKALGVEVLIASDDSVTPANLVAFDMAFYSALLSQVRRGKTTVDRVIESFALADRHYRDVHAVGTPYARFTLTRL